MSAPPKIPWEMLNDRTLKAICRDLGLKYNENSKRELVALLQEVETRGCTCFRGPLSRCSYLMNPPFASERCPTRQHQCVGVGSESHQIFEIA